MHSLIGSSFSRAVILGSLLLALEQHYDAWLNGGLDAVYGGIGARDFLRGRRITVDGEAAVAVQIQRDGRLEITSSNGHAATRTISPARCSSSASCCRPRT